MSLCLLVDLVILEQATQLGGWQFTESMKQNRDKHGPHLSVHSQALVPTRPLQRIVCCLVLQLKGLLMTAKHYFLVSRCPELEKTAENS